MGFFIWSIFINKLNVMSIEKIRERIKMIEENNFEIDERIHNLTTKQVGDISGMTPNIRSKFLSNVGNADSAYQDMRGLMYKHFKTGSKFNITNTNEYEIDLPKQDESNIKNIYRILQNSQVLTGEINGTSFEPVNTYMAVGNIIRSMKGGDIQLEYSDDSHSKLNNVYVKLPSNIKPNPTPNNVTQAFNDIKNLNFVDAANMKMGLKNRIKFKIPIK